MHPHKITSNRRRERRRRARQAWKNYAILEGYTLIIDNDTIQLRRRKDGIDQISTRIQVSMNPARVVTNPKLLAWCLCA